MNIEDLVQLLDNRLREFKLSKDYAKMNGDLERMNAADKEIIGLEDTLYQLNLLADASKSALVKKATLADVITDGSTAVLDQYDITPYATDPKHEEKIMSILSKMGVMDTVEKIDNYIKDRYWGSPVTGEMVISAAEAYEVDARLMMAIMEQDSRFGTAGVAVRTRNPGNVGNNDDGDTRTYDSWQEGVTAVAEWLSRHRGSTIMPDIIEEPVLEPILEPTASSTPSIITPTTSTSTPVITTSTTTTITNLPTPTSTPPTTSTSTPATTATSTSDQITDVQNTNNTQNTNTQTATSTPSTASSTPVTSTPTPPTTATAGQTASSTPSEINEASSISNGAGPVDSTATSTSTTTPSTATSPTSTTASSTPTN